MDTTAKEGNFSGRIRTVTKVLCTFTSFLIQIHAHTPFTLMKIFVMVSSIVFDESAENCADLCVFFLLKTQLKFAKT